MYALTFTTCPLRWWLWCGWPEICYHEGFILKCRVAHKSCDKLLITSSSSRSGFRWFFCHQKFAVALPDHVSLTLESQKRAPLVVLDGLGQCVRFFLCSCSWVGTSHHFLSMNGSTFSLRTSSGPLLQSIFIKLFQGCMFVCAPLALSVLHGSGSFFVCETSGSTGTT